MLTVRGTKKFLDRVGRPMTDPPSPTTVLGDWYSNVLFWRPQVGIDPRFVDSKVTEMSSVVLAKAASRQVLGGRIDFTFMAEHTISTGRSDPAVQIRPFRSGRSDPAVLLELSLWLVNTIVGPISKDDGYTPLGVLQRVAAAALSDR